MTASTMNAVPPVWMYHSVAPYDEDPYEVTVSPQRFERQMLWIRRRGLRGVSMAELLRAQSQGVDRRLVGLTFDDGYQDFITNALPVLSRFGFTATVFVLAGRLGGDNEWSRPGPNKALLTAEDVRAISRAGMEIGSHGLEHISLPETCEVPLNAEVAQSRRILEGLLGQRVQGFCYPYGHLNDRVLNAAQRAGYDYACAVKPSPAVGRHAIPRTLVHERDTSWRLDAKWIVSRLTVGNRHGVRHYRGGQ